VLRYLFEKLGKFLLPESRSGDGARNLEPVDVLQLMYQRTTRLADQIESHAELSPYPQVAERLNRIASEKRDLANRLKGIINSINGTLRERARIPAHGKNHWQRLILDLEDQRALDDLLARYEFTLVRQVPGAADFVGHMQKIHDVHRRSLTQLIAVADPQATQT
jgi:hypothetical protein